MADIIGIFAGFFTTIGALPQIIKAYRTKSVGDISLWMFTTILTGVILWTVYGTIKMDWPIIITNGISAILNGMMILFYFKFSK
ncbi:SemiSWEET transporter [Arenibacter sp. M-2]|uniref:SemiSWEET family sugar transporter n=1 Tax=Arenibacter sp. M-2 TaxID=3053612 RepID=UPI002570C9CB|nr:SemiSWEET transporter [Arenibacter sp. M-2]MDL5513253.1 SemiSWEET transporter [Arenibacter sp. M-2]|tara:strand:- start:6494 stop:6745 length:252 start_codon:yes stop_codon:yes gene_type:complete